MRQIKPPPHSADLIRAPTNLILPLITLKPHHEVSRQEFLEELCLFVLDCFNDELIITRDVED